MGTVIPWSFIFLAAAQVEVPAPAGDYPLPSPPVNRQQAAAARKWSDRLLINLDELREALVEGRRP